MSENKYLEKIALNRTVKNLIEGKLGEASKKLIFNSGVLRSERTYAKGIREGNRYLSKIHGVVHSAAGGGFDKPHLTAVAALGGGASSIPLKDGRVLSTHLKTIPHTTPSFKENLIRHEIHEGREVRKLKTLGRPEMSEKTVAGPIDAAKEIAYSEESRKKLDSLKKSIGTMPKPTLIVGPDSGLRGSHASLAVLGRESNDLRVNPYSHQLKDIRQSTGEAGLISRITNKRFGVDRLSNKDLHKLRTAPTNFSQYFSDSNITLAGYKIRK